MARQSGCEVSTCDNAAYIRSGATWYCAKCYRKVLNARERLK